MTSIYGDPVPLQENEEQMGKIFSGMCLRCLFIKAKGSDGSPVYTRYWKYGGRYWTTKKLYDKLYSMKAFL